MGKILGSGAVFIATLVILISGGVIAVVQATFGSRSPMDCMVAGSTTDVANYGSDQIANAATIVAVGKQMNIPPQGWVVAIAAAMQESGLRNLDHGDRDSLGLFQQRPSQGWGHPTKIMDPTSSATQFYRHLLAVHGWQTMSVNDAAQAVERSGFPGAYAHHEHAARVIVNAVQNSTCDTTGTDNCTDIQAPNAASQAAINYACQQRGLPYQQGGNGPPNGDVGFDCSGLTTAAYATAGIHIPRTAQQQYNAGPLLPANAPLQPGDLIFYGTPNHVHHVSIYIGQNQIIHAPTFDQPVQVAAKSSMSDVVGVSRPTG